MPQFLSALEDWFDAEAAADCLDDDHRRLPALLVERINAAVTVTRDQADDLAAALSAVQNLTAILHATVMPWL